VSEILDHCTIENFWALLRRFSIRSTPGAATLEDGFRRFVAGELVRPESQTAADPLHRHALREPDAGSSPTLEERAAEQVFKALGEDTVYRTMFQSGDEPRTRVEQELKKVAREIPRGEQRDR
jgi:hypothetical protein